MRRAPTGSGVGRKLLVALVVVVALLAAADVGLRLWAESWVAGRVAESLGASEKPDLDLEGFPFLLQFARGRFDRVDVRAEGVRAQGLALRSVTLELEDVRFSRGQLLSRGRGVIRAGTGGGRAVVTDEAVSALIQEQGQPVRVEFVGPGIRVSTTLSIGDRQFEVAASGRLRLREGSVTFSPTRVESPGPLEVPPGTVSFDVPLPELAPGIRYSRIRVASGEASLTVEVEDAAIRVRPAA